MESHDAVIVAAARTPIGTAFKGSLVGVDAFVLATLAVREAVRRAGVEPQLVDDVVLGESLYGGGDIARYAALEAGLVNAPGLAQNRHCASGLAAVQTAAASIRAGMDRLVVAGGVQSASTRPKMAWRPGGGQEWEEDWIPASHRDSADAPNRDMAICVGWNAAVRAGVSRAEMDAWALRSHQRAVAAVDGGAFSEETFPVEVVRGDGTPSTFGLDEHPRRDTTLEKLAALKPLHPEIEGFSITAGNSSGINDAAGVVVVADNSLAEGQGLEPLAVIRGWASAGVPPADTGLAPVVAIPKALQRADLAIDDIDLWEVNEAFASVAVATTKLLGLDEERVNVLGSGCSLGHPVAMTGARMVMSLVFELRRLGGGKGVASMCAGGGMGTALVLDVPAPRPA